jgi:hypothetical protein
MRNKVTKYFIYLTVMILLVTATAKLVSATGHARILNLRDPLLPLTSRQLLVAGAGLEFFVTALLLFGRGSGVKLAAIAWLASNFMAYRLGLVWIGVDEPCWCLGHVTDALKLSPLLVDWGMKLILALLLVGSYGLLALDRWQKRRSIGASPVLENKEIPA